MKKPLRRMIRPNESCVKYTIPGLSFRSRAQTLSETGPTRSETGSVAVDREVHVVLGRAAPGPAPPPADRAEGGENGRRHHSLAQMRAVEVLPARWIVRHPAPDIRILERVEVDRVPVGVVRPCARALPARARRRHRVAAVERTADVVVLL